MSDEKEDWLTLYADCPDGEAEFYARVISLIGRSVSTAADQISEALPLAIKGDASSDERVKIDLVTTKMLSDSKVLIGYANMIRDRFGLPMFYELEELEVQSENS